MSKLAVMAAAKPALSDSDLAKDFGYGAPFAATYRSWLHKTGIGDRGRPFKLTDFGQVVLQHDPKFSSPVTKWFLHHELTFDLERAETWHFFIKEFARGRSTFNRNDLLMGLMVRLRGHSEQHFGPMSKMNPIIVRKLLECYTKPEALGDLGMLRMVGKDEYEFPSVEPIGPWQTPEQLRKAYSDQ